MHSGVQQGDPFSPLLFCLTIYKLCGKLKSSLAIFIRTMVRKVLQDLLTIEEEACRFGQPLAELVEK